MHILMQKNKADNYFAYSCRLHQIMQIRPYNVISPMALQVLKFIFQCSYITVTWTLLHYNFSGYFVNLLQFDLKDE